jgi:hypothetical protein
VRLDDTAGARRAFLGEWVPLTSARLFLADE